jgi:RNA polymerase sigma-70 factor, ECF subfamily
MENVACCEPTSCLPEAHDREGVGQVLEACRRYLLALARTKIDPGLHAKAGASDLVQETLLEAQRDYASFHGESEADVLAWLRKLLLNNVSNFRRRYRGAAKRSISREERIDAAACRPSSRSNGEDPAWCAEEHDQLRFLQTQIARLPADYHRVLALWYEERSFEEIGRAMNRSTDAARMLWMRAIERLRDLVEE